MTEPPDRRHDMDNHHQDNQDKEPDSGNRDQPGPLSEDALATVDVVRQQSSLLADRAGACAVLSAVGVLLALEEGRDMTGSAVRMPQHVADDLIAAIDAERRQVGAVEAGVKILHCISGALELLTATCPPRDVPDLGDGSPLWRSVSWLASAAWMELGLHAERVSLQDFAAPDDISQLGLGLDEDS